MATTEQEKAALSGKRGKLAAGISDPEEKRKFIAAQGEVDRKGGKDVDYADLSQKTENEENRQAVENVLGPTAEESTKAPYSIARDASK